MAFYPRADAESIVIDVGSGIVKAGFSGRDAPEVTFDTLGSHLNVDDQASDVAGSHKLPVPLRRGVLQDWDSMGSVWRRALDDELRVDPDASGTPVLLTDAPLSSKQSREKTAEMMFEDFKVPGLYIANQAVLSLYACGKTRGLVVEIGEGSTYSVPIFEGFALPHASTSLPVAGGDLTGYLRNMLKDRGHAFTNSIAHTNIIRGMKESLCVVSDNYEQDIQSDTNEYAFELPDGQALSIDAHCRYSVPESLFNPTILKSRADSSGDGKPVGIADIAMESINHCDKDLQPDLYSNLVLSGGSSLFNGLKSRMQYEMEERAEDGEPVDVVVDSQRKYASWIGGSMFASLGTINQIYVTRQEYEDSGATVVHRKCF